MKKDIISRGRSVSDLKAHLVLTTKYRRKVLTGAMIDRLHEIFESLLDKFDCKIVEFNGERDYIELRKVTTTTKNLSFAIICLPRCYVNKVKYTIMTLLYNV
ncbi:MAG: transposase, partial [Xenococcus sp. (in: cyanobacteria)]